MKNLTVLLILITLLLSAETKLSVEDCRELALKNNHEIKISGNIRTSAEYNQKAAFTRFLPRFDVTGTYQRVGEKFSLNIPEMQNLPVIGELSDGTIGQIGEVPLNQIQSDLDMYEYEFGSENNFLIFGSMEFPIFTGGKILNQYKISKDLTAISEANEKSSVSDVLCNVDEYYWQLISLREKVELCNKYNEMIISHIKDLENFKIEGIITDNELLKAEVLKNEAELKLSKAENGVDLVNMALCRLIGLPLNEKIVTVNELVLDKDNIYDYDELIEIAVKNRSELTILENIAKIAKSKESIVRGTYLPNIVLNANYNLVNPNPYNGFEEEFGTDWMVGITCTMEIFNFNRRGYELQSSKFQKNAAEMKLAQTKEMIKLDVRRSLFNINDSKKRINLTETAMKQANKNLKIRNDYFAEGIVKSSEVLDAQTLWQKAYSEKIDAVYEYKLNKSRLKKALGNIKYMQN
jgi:outer membrane protein